MNKTTTEIERKFLARIVGSLPVDLLEKSTQWYMVVRPNWEWRVREVWYHDELHQVKNEWFSALKFGNGLTRKEYEMQIPRFVGELFSAFGGTPIEKWRTYSHRWEIDEFIGPANLKGLVLAEVELTSATETLPTPPAGLQLIREVTEDSRWSNKNLSRQGMPTSANRPSSL